MSQKLLETLADIAYFAGQKGYYSGDSREDIMIFVEWAKEFENIHKRTDWHITDYILTVEAFAEEELLLLKLFSRLYSKNR